MKGQCRFGQPNQACYARRPGASLVVTVVLRQKWLMHAHKNSVGRESISNTTRTIFGFSEPHGKLD